MSSLTRFPQLALILNHDISLDAQFEPLLLALAALTFTNIKPMGEALQLDIL